MCVAKVASESENTKQYQVLLIDLVATSGR